MSTGPQNCDILSLLSPILAGSRRVGLQSHVGYELWKSIRLGKTVVALTFMEFSGIYLESSVWGFHLFSAFFKSSQWLLGSGLVALTISWQPMKFALWKASLGLSQEHGRKLLILLDSWAKHLYGGPFQKTRQIIKATGVTKILFNIVRCIILDFSWNLHCQINSIYLLNAFLTVFVDMNSHLQQKFTFLSLIKLKIMLSFNFLFILSLKKPKVQFSGILGPDLKHTVSTFNMYWYIWKYIHWLLLFFKYLLAFAEKLQIFFHIALTICAYVHVRMCIYFYPPVDFLRVYT